MDVSIWINKMLESFQENDVTTVIKLLKDAKISNKGDIYIIVKKVLPNIKNIIELLFYFIYYLLLLLLLQHFLFLLKIP